MDLSPASTNETYTFECGVECPVARGFAWRFWTTVSNWAFDSDIESVELNGPFTSGSHGVTMSRSCGRIEWKLSSVQPEKNAIVEISVLGAIARFEWLFEDSGGATRITQRVSIEGENARSLGQALQRGIPEGMKKLCTKMAESTSDSSDGGPRGFLD
jgi:hypothetical protein